MEITLRKWPTLLISEELGNSLTNVKDSELSAHFGHIFYLIVQKLTTTIISIYSLKKSFSLKLTKSL